MGLLFLEVVSQNVSATKMKFLTLFLTYNVSARNLDVDQAIDVDICNADVTNSYISNLVLEITPFPIQIKPSATIQLHFAVDVIKEIPVGTTLTLDLKKGILPIPCLEIPGVPVPIGSCKYDLQQ